MTHDLVIPSARANLGLKLRMTASVILVTAVISRLRFGLRTPDCQGVSDVMDASEVSGS